MSCYSFVILSSSCDQFKLAITNTRLNVLFEIIMPQVTTYSEIHTDTYCTKRIPSLMLTIMFRLLLQTNH